MQNTRTNFVNNKQWTNQCTDGHSMRLDGAENNKYLKLQNVVMSKYRGSSLRLRIVQCYNSGKARW